MSKFLTQTYTISNHPISRLKEKFQRQYIFALGEFLCYYTKNDTITRFIFEVWSKSIHGRVIKGSYSYTAKFVRIKSGLAIHRDGFRLFSMRMPLLFDCYYLLEKANRNNVINTYAFFSNNVGNIFNKKAINYSYNYFSGANSGGLYSNEQRSHRNKDKEFFNNKLKRVLVVATMSAGKSTLINAMVGHKINPVRATACTSKIRYIYNKPAKEGTVAFNGLNGLIYTSDYTIFLNENHCSLGINFASSLRDQHICLIDTPGVNYSGNASHGQMTRDAIQNNNYELLLLILNGQQLAIDDEKDLISFIGKNCKKKVLCVVNQCDYYNETEESIEDAIKTAREILHKNGIKSHVVIPTSGLAACRIRKLSEPKHLWDKNDVFHYERTLKIFNDPYYDMLSYCHNVPHMLKNDTPLSRTCIPYLEYLLSTL